MKKVLQRITPSPEEAARMQAHSRKLLAAARGAMADAGLHGEPTIQGSVAKGTWLAGSGDVDVFLLLDDGDDDVLKQAAQIVGHAILDDPQTKYAQHPYLVGRFQGLDVDLVPAYRITEASARMSAVDRTPFHTQWVLSHSDEALRGDIRLAKQWCKGVEVYGADTATGGFSGYLVEVLVIHAGSFDAFVGQVSDGLAGRRIAPGPDDVDDDVSPLVVVDPVDATRNCAAAVTDTVLERAREAARAYLEAPDERFFFPAPPEADLDGLPAALREQGASWVGLTMTPQTDRLDLVLPQFQRAGRALSDALQRAGFPVRRHRLDVVDGDVCMQWITDDVQLPATATHIGPPADGGPNADRFNRKWQDHPDAVAPPSEVDGRLTVEVQVPHRRPATWLDAHLERFQAGKHVQKALRRHAVHDAPPSGSWAPTITDFVLDRPPWQR